MNKYGVRVVLIAVAVIAGLGIVWNIRGALQRHRSGGARNTATDDQGMFGRAH